ncbi:uncharacterized protein LOC111484580 isoform X1 [Cucurbita maxima]|uniref:Uncharacterized protein LOC111484580 isoform X1 n=1 Tax=Cucurbita maxima TaxID=3661 RepID=A0A6J1JCV9_CUCMA|nr:uncharacterized protein LOC111484580 isoform X1 [Cucurbita maxima]
MSWTDQKTEKKCKIRKRVCLSSPSSSTLVRKYRFKKPPTWKMNTKSHSSKLSSGDLANQSPSCSVDSGGGKGKQCSVSVSARKSAAEKTQKLKKEVIKTQELVSQIWHSCLSDPDPSFNILETEKVEGGRVQGRRRTTTRTGTGEVMGGSNFHGKDCLMEIENGNVVKTRLKEVSNWLTTSKELLRVLNHVCGHEEQRQSSALSLISALKSELDRAKSGVDELIVKEQSFRDDEIEVVMKAAWKNRERAITSMADEIEVEKKRRRQAERLNKSIAKELADTKALVSKLRRDLQREKRAKEILEQICEELAAGIGEDRAELEELKRESAKVREEVEKEREMLRLVDVLREERVQMKLSEAKFEFEEKNAAVERLKHQLEGYLVGNDEHEQDHCCNKFEKIKELEAYLKRINFGSCRDQDQEQECSDSEESDLHSIELNMDDGDDKKSYRWSFVHGGSQKNSLEKSNPISEKIQWGSICLNTTNPSTATHQQNSNRFSELFTHNLQEQGDDHQVKSLNCLRDILFPETTPELDQIPAAKTDNHNGIPQIMKG